jgi:hypothetical protein
MKVSELKVSIKLAWWLRAYLHGVQLVSHLTGLNPDPDKVAYWVERGTKIKVR